MPAGRRQQSNGMLYTVITFVSLFLIATVAAVILYVKVEDYKTANADLRQDMETLATSQQRRNIGALVGELERRETVFGALSGYVDEMARLVMGGAVEEASAQLKVENARSEAAAMHEILTAEVLSPEELEPNSTGLLSLLGIVKGRYDNLSETLNGTQRRLMDLQKRFDNAVEAAYEKEQRLLAEKEEYHQQVINITTDYEQLKDLMEQSSEQRVQMVMADLEAERDRSEKLKDELLKTQAQLSNEQGLRKQAQEKLESIVPPPGIDVPAFKPDGRIMMIDKQTDIVHLSIGSANRVYRGLTFSVYDKNAPIPKDGKGKAEIEVFEIAENYSAARILRDEINRPIVEGDVIANLIWDGSRTNRFVVAGVFAGDEPTADDEEQENEDMTGEKIREMIAQWGGQVDDEVTINTDFVVLGNPPEVPRKPTLATLDVYPLAMEQYEKAMESLAYYRQVRDEAASMNKPIFNTERFLYFVGQKDLSPATAKNF